LKSTFKNSTSLLRLPYSLRQQAGKAFWLPDGHVGEHFPVYRDAGLLQSVHELAVGDSVGTAGGIDAQNPESTQVTFTLAPVEISIIQRVYHGLGGAPYQLVFGAPLSFGQGQDFLVSMV
jgi:hypothetical protein